MASSFFSRSASTRRAFALASVGVLAWTGSSCTIIGAACKTGSDCDETSYCQSDDGDCGPGTCQKRPGNARGAELFLSCGCDGKIYYTAKGAHFHGTDVGNNSRCEPNRGLNWRCGDRIFCGSKPCSDITEICNPMFVCDGTNGFGGFACVHSAESGYYCAVLGYDITSCDDPHILDVCNGCVPEAPCGMDNTHEFGSATCTEDECQLRTIECIK